VSGGPSWLREHPIAHRGLHSAQVPENSMAAFEAAVSAGYGIELDVHLSADDRLVVMHDEELRRTTGQPGRVGELDSGLLRGIALLGTDGNVPLLDDVLSVVAGRVPLLVEVKTGDASPSRVGRAVARALAGYRGPHAVQSFDPRLLIWLRRNVPELLRGQIAEAFRRGSLPLGRRLALRTMVLNGRSRPHFIAYDVDAVPSLAVAVWRRLLRVPLLVWTVQTVAQLERARRVRANVIFEDIDPGPPRR
jgi:glycerophosphoryl diester phosphodiesterase